MEEMEEMVSGGITSFKIFFAYDDLKLDDESIYAALKKAKELGVLIGFHCENGDLIEKLREDALSQGNIEPIYHMLTRPPSLEREAISRLTTIAELIDLPIYIVHLSSKEGYYEIEKARERGNTIIVETCPQYLLLNKDYYIPKGEDKFEGAKYVLSPPLRDKESNEVLWNGIKFGQIDVVATDHCAFNYKGQKELGIKDFTKIPNGGPGVENRLKLLYTYGVRKDIIGMEKLVEVFSENPAKIFGLYPKKGVIQEGSHGDIIIFNPEHTSFISAENQIQNVDYSLYEGFSQYGKLEYVFLRGQKLVENEKIIVSQPLGLFQKRNKFK
jgi:dihydropyrimidinase